METLFVHLALLLYTLAVGAFLAWLLRPVPRRARAGRLFMAAGALLHAGSLAIGAAATLPVGAWRGGQIFSWLAALTVAGYLFIDRRGSNPLIGAFVAPLAVSLMAPAHLVASSARSVAPPVARSFALVVHVAASALGTAALVLAFGLALLYLASERQVKTKRPGRLFSRLTSLDSIDRGGFRCAIWGFVFLSVANVSGAIVSSQASGSPLPFAAKQVFAILAWALLAATLQARLVSGWRGRRSAVLVLAGSALVAGVYAALLSGPAASPLAAFAGVFP